MSAIEFQDISLIKDYHKKKPLEKNAELIHLISRSLNFLI
ncbi:hypothetical protein H1P_2580014 [Hyella patelloides LEGE 07179]|uniref:Uncharacterized protein n=1 Tax=Hyella patelloides LEGE 07179 TaxID=945734 RepID=A0A563VSE8_9CYAN|nr:hypothetical protein H1P_2580014 [Hyella patelloides LEGE 07179]